MPSQLRARLKVNDTAIPKLQVPFLQFFTPFFLLSAGSDFSDTSAYLTFDSEGTICFEIPINATDAALENDETFVVVLTTRDDDIEITRQTAKVIIVDDSNVMIGFELQSYTTPEEDDSGNGAIVEVCVVVYSGGNQLERDVIVSLSTTEVTASGTYTSRVGVF